MRWWINPGSNKDCGISEQQWKKKLAEWRLSKNIPPRVTKFIKKKARRRLINHEKHTLFRLNQEAIPMDKVKRYEQAAGAESEGAVSPTGSKFKITYNSSRYLN